MTWEKIERYITLYQLTLELVSSRGKFFAGLRHTNELCPLFSDDQPTMLEAASQVIQIHQALVKKNGLK